jgi:hypothetical protein
MVKAGEDGTSVAYDENVGKVLKTLGQPLELTNLGQTKASLRLDSRYIKDVLQKVDQDSVSWTPIADHLRETYGFQPLLIDLFLGFLCQRDHRALEDISGEPIDVRIGMSQTTRIRLQRGKLVSAADWHRLRDLGNQLFEIPRPAATRSLQAQDRFTAELRTKGQQKRTVLQGIHSHLVKLGVDKSDRLTELSTANTRLGPLAQSTTDTHKVLSELLAIWPDDTSDALRTIVQQAEVIRDALAELNEHARTNLTAGVNHPVVGTEVRGHLAALGGRLAAAQAEQPLTKDWISTWNKKAQELIKRLIEQPQPPQAPQPPVGGGGFQPPVGGGGVQPPVGGPDVTPRTVLLKKRVNPSDADAISDFLAEVRKALTSRARSPSASCSCARRSSSEFIPAPPSSSSRSSWRCQRDGLRARDRRRGARELARPDAHAEGLLRRASRRLRARSAAPPVEGQGRAAHRGDARGRGEAHPERAGPASPREATSASTR